MTRPVADQVAADLAWLRAYESRVAPRWCPLDPHERQAEFLACAETEALYGGATGGGKTAALLMAALEHVDVPKYAALVLRRTFPDLAQPGGPMHLAGEWLHPSAATWNDRDKAWTFPSGAVLRFGYMQHTKDIYRYQGGEYQLFCFDELTQFREQQYTYLFSRARKRTGEAWDRIPLRFRSAANPGGVGHEWVRARFGIREDGTQDASSARNARGELRPFVQSFAKDNPGIDVESYMAMLDELDEVTRRQLRDGLWLQDSTGLVLPLTRRNVVDAPPEHVPLLHVLAMDFGSSEVEETLALVVLAWSPHVPRQVWVVRAEKHCAMMLDELAARIRELDARYDFGRVVADEGALGVQFGRELRARFGIPVRPAKKADRIGYIRLLRDAARRGDLLLVRDDANALHDEASSLLWHEDGRRTVGTCHAYDATLYGWRMARAWAAEEPQPEPAEGSHEWLERRKRALARRRAKERKEWWR